MGRTCAPDTYKVSMIDKHGKMLAFASYILILDDEPLLINPIFFSSLYTNIIFKIKIKNGVNSPSALDHYKAQKKEDHHLIQTIAATIRTHNYHTKAYINRKYSSVMRV